MSTPYDPDRPSDQPGYPPQGNAPQYGQQYGQQPGQYGQQYGQPGQQPDQSHQGYPPAPDPGQQQYAGSPGGFGSAPAYSNYGTPPGAGAKPNPPSDVVRAVQLMLASVVIGIIGAILTFTSGDSIRESIRESDPSLTAAEVDQAYNLGVGVAVFFGLVFAVLYALLAFQVRKGKNWARIVTFVLAGLGVLGGLLGLIGTGTSLEKVLNVIQLLIAVGIIVFLARRPANEYFAAMKGPRY